MSIIKLVRILATSFATVAYVLGTYSIVSDMIRYDEFGLGSAAVVSMVTALYLLFVLVTRTLARK